MKWWSKLTGKVTRREFEALERKVTKLMANVNELEGELRTIRQQNEKALGEIRSKLDELLLRITTLEGQLANQELPDGAQAELTALKVAAQALDDVVPDAPTPTP